MRVRALYFARDSGFRLCQRVNIHILPSDLARPRPRTWWHLIESDALATQYRATARPLRHSFSARDHTRVGNGSHRAHT